MGSDSIDVHQTLPRCYINIDVDINNDAVDIRNSPAPGDDDRWDLHVHRRKWDFALSDVSFVNWIINVAQVNSMDSRCRPFLSAYNLMRTGQMRPKIITT